MQYRHYPNRPERLTAEFVEARFGELRARVPAAEASATHHEWTGLLRGWNELHSYLQSDLIRLSLRVGADSSDEAAAGEEEAFFRDIIPVIDAHEHELFGTLLKSRHRRSLESFHGAYFFERIERERAFDTPETLRIAQQRDELLNRMDAALAKRRFLLDGRVVTEGEIQSHLRSSDPVERRRAFEAMGNANLSVADEMAGIVTLVVRARHEQARVVGRPNFVELGYAEMGRTGVRPEDMQRLRDAIERHLVPLATEMSREHARRLGTANVGVADLFYEPAITLPRGIAAPVETLLDRMESLFTALSPRLGGHFRQMREWDLVDIESRLGKYPVATCANLFDEGRVKITMSAVGDASDVTTLLHEAGHAFQKFESGAIELIDLQTPTNELAEVHAETMEFLGSRYIDRVLPSEYADTYRSRQLTVPVRSLCAIARFDAFQHWMYEHPDADAPAREAKLMELEDRFSPGIDWTGYERYRRMRSYEAMQFYANPFGLMNYGLARMIALQIARIDATDHERAMEIYLELCRLGGTVSYLEAIERVGLRSPFDESTIIDLAEFLGGGRREREEGGGRRDEG
jgi:M3 family oligoendopeptidase